MAKQFQSDVIKTSVGDLKMTFLGHGTLMFEIRGAVIHIDPYGQVADYGELPKADLVLITHEHGDHLDLGALAKIRTGKTKVVCTPSCASRVEDGILMMNGDERTVAGIRIEAIPAYNIEHERAPGQPFHPQGVGNGYLLTFGDTRVYVAGDTEDTPEMRALSDIDVAFLPMNLPYTMTPEMVADAVKAFKPTVVYPYHYGQTDPTELVALLRDEPDVEVRIRDLA